MTAEILVDTIARIVPQLTLEQLRRLSAARRPLDDDRFDEALDRAEDSGPGLSDDVSEALQLAWDVSEDRFDAWQDSYRSEPFATVGGRARTVVATVGAVFLIVGSPLALVAAVLSSAPWFAPLLILAGSLVVLVSALWPEIMKVESDIDDRGLILDEAWDAINGAIQAISAVGLDQADYDLLTGPWSTAILRLPPRIEPIELPRAA